MEVSSSGFNKDGLIFVGSILKKEMEDKAFENWVAKKQQIKKDYPQLTEDDLVYKAGQEIELLERLQKKLKKSKDEIKTWLAYIGYV